MRQEKEQAMKPVSLIQCPECRRLFADQLSPRGDGYVFPVHAFNAHPGKRERLRTCPGSSKPIAREHRVKAEYIGRTVIQTESGPKRILPREV
jgi:hypothetical protein